jgi:hypothetical protein
MMKNKIIVGLMGIFLAIALINFVSSADEANYCCEKTKAGAWCQNSPVSECDSNFKTSPTSCDSTSYCKRGCCFDSQEGLCMENTAQRVCEDSDGTWADDASCNIAQCNLGCCILADQGAFVTLARCRALSGFYGLKTDFRKTIGDEISCIAVAQGEDKGACVFEDPETLQNTCKFTTRTACKTAGLNSEIINATIVNGTSNKTKAGPGFYKDMLCTAPELGTNCAKSTETMLIDGKDEVYYKDTCDQPANIYDASKYNDNAYWRKVYKKSESCGAGTNNANNPSCGNCDYYLGSIGKKTSGILGSPTYGEYICVDLGCKDAKKKHGESWCVKDSPSGDGQDPVGSRYFKEVCLNGEVLTEPCADFRGEICIEDEFNDFSEAACRVNRWQDCSQQLEADDCENYDQRDCKWIEGYYFSTTKGQIEKSNNNSKKGPITPKGLCVPNYPPGSQFWATSVGKAPTTTAVGLGNTGSAFPSGNGSIRQTSEYGTGYVNPSSAGTSTKDMCSSGNAKVEFKWVKSTKPLAFWESSPSWECEESTGNCQYLSDDDIKNAELSQSSIDRWSSDMNDICYQLGDCGGYINYLGKYTEDGYAAYKDGERVAGSGGAEILEKTKTTTSSSGAIGGQRQTPSLGDAASSIDSATSALGGINAKVTGNVISDMLREIFIG